MKKEGLNNIDQKLRAFRRKYYLNLFVKGTLLTLSFVLAYFLIASLIEYNLWLSGTARFLIFGTFFLVVIFCVFRFLKEPLSWWLYKKGMGQEESAKMIGSFFPSINDRLLNVIQLSRDERHTALLHAGIAQKSSQFENISFEKAIDIRDNKRYLKYFAIPFVMILLLWIFNSRIFTQSTSRIVHFSQEFSPEAPFQFVIENKNLDAFFNEDFVLNLKLKGDAIADAVYIVSGQQRLKMENQASGEFTYTFDNIQNPVDFQFEASGFYSGLQTIRLISRPELGGLSVELQYPKYLNQKTDLLSNAANLEMPEGTLVTWQLRTSNSSKAKISFISSKDSVDMQMIDNQLFNYQKSIHQSDQYAIHLENDYSYNRDQISYSIHVLKDEYPELIVDHLQDSMLYSSIVLGGSAKDDHGITDLMVRYQIVNDNGNKAFKGIKIPLNSHQAQQSFFYQWSLDSLKLSPGDQLNYYIEVWDNDGVNGRKSTKSAMYQFKLPGTDELKAEISRSQSSAESKIDQSLNKAKDLKQSIDDAQQKLKGKQSLEWQDKKMLEDLLEQKKKLDQTINDLKKENEMLDQKKESFSEESERIKEKSEQIQKLMNELLDPETKKLFEELEKLLKENSDMSQMQKVLDKMDRKEINLEKELERTLELFKQLQYDYKLEQAISEIKEQANKQEELLKKTEELSGEKKSKDGQNKDSKEEKQSQEKGNDKSSDEKEGSDQSQNDKDSKEKNQGADQSKKEEKPDAKELAKDQEELSKDFEKFEKVVEDLDKMGEELNEEGETPSGQEMKDVKDTQHQSKESLQQGKPKKSSESQKKSVQQMKQMQQKLEGMQNAMEMEMNMENIESLRQILHGLIKLSFDQESLMKDFVPIQQTDPKYIQLSQNQLKIKDDAKVLEDSLLALGKRDPMLGSVVTREVGDLNDHIEKSMENIRERRKGNAGSEMQLSMTSINNLALMLNDHFDMMMDAMANAKPDSGKKKKKGQQSLGEIQQKLNNQIEQIKKGGQSGRALSEELSKMAAEQERIRRALQEMQEKLKQEGGKPLGNDIPGKMEQTEMELVNKQITEQTIRRQKEILTRLLEAEKSMREQNMDEERKGETAKDYQKEFPRAFEEYLRLKEKELELLKTVPPKLYPYYKKEVNDYFKRIGTQD